MKSIDPSIRVWLEDRGKAIRDPIWEYIYLSKGFEALVDTEDFQRLRRISQLGHVSWVYPGARHSRFEHSMGVHHLSKKFLLKLLESEPPLAISEDDVKVFLTASLLHDIGHYPFSHVLEELGDLFIHHEERGRRIIMDSTSEIHDVIRNTLEIDPVRVANVIDADNPKFPIPAEDRLLNKIISGTLDPDKIDYLLRDSLYCGVPFGLSVNKWQLIDSITFDATRQRLAITHKGISSIESLIFTNYLMYRNVYWHHGVRAAVSMFKRAVWETVAHPDCTLRVEDFERIDEFQLVELLRREIRNRDDPHLHRLFEDMLRRRLYKVGRIFYSHEKDTSFVKLFHELYKHPGKRFETETGLSKIFAKRLGKEIPDNAVLIDIPSFSKSLEIDLKVFYGDHAPEGCEDPLAFDDWHVTRLKEYLVDNFEEHAKVFRIFCLDDEGLRMDLKDNVKKMLSQPLSAAP